ncbi:MAG: hypothetical protein JSW15_04550, partial [Deltaproteobacteria bacterium]
SHAFDNIFFNQIPPFADTINGYETFLHIDRYLGMNKKKWAIGIALMPFFLSFLAANFVLDAMFGDNIEIANIWMQSIGCQPQPQTSHTTEIGIYQGFSHMNSPWPSLTFWNTPWSVAGRSEK